jgi:hypothetical protein
MITQYIILAAIAVLGFIIIRQLNKSFKLLMAEILKIVISKPAGMHVKMFINHYYKSNTKGVIMEANVKVDQTGLAVFDSPKDKYGNNTGLNGDLTFSSSDDSVATFTKATQEEIDAYNNDANTQEADKIPAELAGYVGTFKSNGTVGTALLKVTGDPSTADDDTPVEGTLTLHVGAGNASNFGTVRLLGVKDDTDEG